MSPDSEHTGPRAVDRGSGLLVGRPFGVPVYVAPTWLVVAALITVWFAPSVAGELPGIGAWRYAVSFAFAVLLYLSVLVHELAHSLVALRLGLPVRRITLHLLGGVSEIAREPETPGREFAIAFAGPLLSLVLGALGVATALVLTDGTVANLLAVQVAQANLLVGCFNLLPGLPLDGGRVVQAGVWWASGRRMTGIVVAAWAGRGIAVVVLVLPLLLAAARGQRADLVPVVWSAMIASFVWLGAGEALASARVRERLPALTTRTLTRRAMPVTGDVPLAEALRRAGEHGASALVVTDADGRPAALVNAASVAATPEHRRPWVRVDALARALEPALVLSVDLAGEALVTAMSAAPASEYLVVDAEGKVVGVLASADVEAAFAGG